MHGKPLSSIAAELNNVLTVFAMCTDEVEDLGPTGEVVADMRDAVRRGAELTRALLTEAAARTDESAPVISEIVTTHVPTVLVVDEDTSMRRAVARAVLARGFRVLEAPHVDAALQSLETVNAIDVVVVDTALEGRRFAGRIVERYPGASVLYTGGFTDDEPLRRELPSSNVSLLCRPFTTNILLDRIDQALAKKR